MSKRFVALRGAAVGGAATLLDLLVLAALVEGVGWAPAAANVPALVAGVAVQFAGSEWFTFRRGRGLAEERPAVVVRQGALFLLVEAAAFALNALLFHGLVSLGLVPYVIARLGTQAAVYFGFSLPLWSRVFAAVGTGRHPAASAPLRPGAEGGRMAEWT